MTLRDHFSKNMSCSLGWHSCKDETHNTRQKLMTPNAWVCSIAVTHQPQKHLKTPKGLDISDLLANCLQESADLQQPKLADSRDNKGRREVVSPSPTPGSLPWLPHGRAMTPLVSFYFLQFSHVPHCNPLCFKLSHGTTQTYPRVRFEKDWELTRLPTSHRFRSPHLP